MKKQALFVIIFIALCSSCDRWGKYQYQVQNSSDKVITVSFQDVNTNTVQHIVVHPGKSKIIMETLTENLGKNEMPSGIWAKNDTIKDFKSLDIKIGEQIINRDFRVAKYWTYKAENKDIGIYNIEIVDK